MRQHILAWRRGWGAPAEALLRRLRHSRRVSSWAEWHSVDSAVPRISSSHCFLIRSVIRTLDSCFQTQGLRRVRLQAWKDSPEFGVDPAFDLPAQLTYLAEECGPHASDSLFRRACFYSIGNVVPASLLATGSLCPTQPLMPSGAVSRQTSRRGEITGGVDPIRMLAGG